MSDKADKQQHLTVESFSVSVHSEGKADNVDMWVTGAVCEVEPGLFSFFSLSIHEREHGKKPESMFIPISYMLQENEDLHQGELLAQHAIDEHGKLINPDFVMPFRYCVNAAAACLDHYQAMVEKREEKRAAIYAEKRKGFTVVDGGQTRH